MSIKNLQNPNFTGDVYANNIKTQELPIVLVPLGGFTIDTLSPVATFTRIGNFITVSGILDIGITQSNVYSINIKITIPTIDDNYNSIKNVKTMSGAGLCSVLLPSAGAIIPNFIATLDTLTSIVMSFNNTTPLINTNDYKLNYYFSYELRQF